VVVDEVELGGAMEDVGDVECLPHAPVDLRVLDVPVRAHRVEPG
jgi:hypothetical protein